MCVFSESLGGPDANRSHFAEPGEVIVPWNEPEVKLGLVFKSASRSTVKLPVAPANRPEPPMIVWTSTIRNTPGVSVGPLVPAAVVKISSPLAAVKRTGPDPVPSARFTVKCQVIVNRPRWVAIPPPLPSATSVPGDGNVAASAACSVPLKGTSFSAAQTGEPVTSKPQTINMGLATLEILEANFLCIGTSFKVIT